MTEHPYVRHTDPGHEWLEVPVSELVELNVAEYITEYSHISKDSQTAYLEGDCDEVTFLAAYLEKFGHPYAASESYTGSDCFVRGLNMYTAGSKSEECWKQTEAILKAAYEKWGEIPLNNDVVLSKGGICRWAPYKGKAV